LNSKTLFKHIGLAFLFQIGIKLIWLFVIDRSAQNQFGEKYYGFYFSYMQLLTIVAMVADGGLHNFATLHLNNNLNHGLPQSIKNLKNILVLAYLLICCLLYIQIPTELKPLFILVAGLQLLNSYFLWQRSILRGHLANKHDAIVSSLDKLVVVILALSTWAFFSNLITLLNFVYVQIIGLAVAIIYAKINIPTLPTNNKYKLSNHNFLQIFLFGLLMVFMTAIYRLDAYLLNLLHPLGSIASGRYAAAFRLLDAANMLGYVTATYLFSFAAVNKNNITYLQKNAFIICKWLVAIAFIGIIILLFFGNFIGKLLYYKPNEETIGLIKYILLILPALFIIHVYGSIISACGNLKKFLLLTIVVCVINILLNILAIPYYGTMGSFYAALTSQYLYAAICIYMVNIMPTNNTAAIN
jgi:O-antigen/teichoic acid export membrane protein